MENVLEAVIVHNKHNWPANENARTYIAATLRSTIVNKFEKEVSGIVFSHKDIEVRARLVFREDVSEERKGVVKNNLSKQMRNMSKRFNSRSYVKESNSTAV